LEREGCFNAARSTRTVWRHVRSCQASSTEHTSPQNFCCVLFSDYLFVFIASGASRVFSLVVFTFWGCFYLALYQGKSLF